MPYVEIKDVLTFSSNNGVNLEWGALDLSPQELYETVKTAFGHLDDQPLKDACCGGTGPLSTLGKIQYEDYVQLLREASIQDAAEEVKKTHTKIRRTTFQRLRSDLLLAMIEAGVRYECAHPDCSIYQCLTIDHLVPLSRGGTDDLSNLQFLCQSHNSAKGDRY